MTYELAKKLKEAGFPQKGFWFYSSNETDMPCLTYETNPYDTCGIEFIKEDFHISPEKPELVVKLPRCKKIVLCYAPTLSELLEACGDRFFGLFRCTAHSDLTGRYCWKAEGLDEMRMNVTVLVSDNITPEEAVANLWLKLNAK